MTGLHGFGLMADAILPLVVALLGTITVRQLARRRGWLAKPRADRWHRRPIALHGGMGFYPAFVLCASLSLAVSANVVWQSDGATVSAFPASVKLGGSLLLGSLLMFGIGVWDDLYDLSPVAKLISQVLSAALFMLAGGVCALTESPAMNALITGLWFVGITNAVNMLDNMDGLSSGVVIIAATTLAVLSSVGPLSVTENMLGARLSLTLAGALAGFWIFNRAPASIFMGDSGSLSIGYLIAGLAVPGPLNDNWGWPGGERAEVGVAAMMIPVLVLLVPIYDTTLVTLTRMWRAQPVSQGGCDHSSHRLVRLGLSEADAVMALYALSAAGSVMAFLVQRYPRQAMPWLVGFVSMVIVSGIYLGRTRLLDVQPSRSRG